jgi:hypothetical protein
MDSKTKKYLMIGGALVLAYFLYKKYGKKVGLPTMSKGKGESNFTEMDSIMDAAISD